MGGQGSPCGAWSRVEGDGGTQGGLGPGAGAAVWGQGLGGETSVWAPAGTACLVRLSASSLLLKGLYFLVALT